MVRDILSRSPAWDEGRGLSYPPCLLMKPVLRLRLHATQSQPCFPAASNALALPGGNGIFTATPTERITHYTLLRKVVCQMGALPPLETPTRKGGTLPLHGAHTAFSCYPALRLYRLSKSQRGNGVVSLTLGNSVLPLGHGLIADTEPVSQLLLGVVLLLLQRPDGGAGDILGHRNPSFWFLPSGYQTWTAAATYAA